jgi:hypothetical protein
MLSQAHDDRDRKPKKTESDRDKKSAEFRTVEPGQIKGQARGSKSERRQERKSDDDPVSKIANGRVDALFGTFE